MLVACAHDFRTRESERFLARLSASVGRPNTTLEDSSWALWAWPPASVDLTRTSVIEGWLDLQGPITLTSVRQAGGDFALAAPMHDGLLLAAGPAGGHRPIFVARPSSSSLLASTRLSALLRVLPPRCALDLDFLAASIVHFGGYPSSKTPYRNIQRLPLGEAWLALRDGNQERLSTFRPLAARELRVSERDTAVLFREALTSSVRRAIQGARRVAVAVSGGLDSSAVFSIAQSLANAGDLADPPLGLAFDFDAPSAGDDRAYWQSLAEHLKVNILGITPGEASGFLRPQLVLDAIPCRAATTALSVTLAKRALEQGVGVVLSGVGGDDVANGQLALFGDLVRKGRLRAATTALLGMRGLYHMGKAHRLRYLALTSMRPFVPSMVKRAAWAREMNGMYPWAGPRLRRHLRDVATVWISAPRPSLDDEPSERYRKLLALPIFRFIHLIRHQEEAAGGNIRRDPFLDDEFLRFVATLPAFSLMQGGFLRGLLRESMRGLLPERVRLRETKGYVAYAIMQMVAAAGGSRVIEDLSDVRMLADLQIIEPKPFQRHFKRILREPFCIGLGGFWPAIAAEAFVRQHAGEGL